MPSQSRSFAKRSVRGHVALGIIFASHLSLLGCQSTGQSDPAGDSLGNSGDVNLALTLADGATVDVVSYSITGPTPLTGTIQVSKSATVSATLGPLVAGDNYAIVLTATSSAGYACEGSSGPFSVIANKATPVSIAVACHPNRNAGSVQVNGTVSVCPGIDSVVANPSETYVGNDIQLTATASPDGTADGFPLTYSWSGITSSDALGNAVFHCTVPGTFAVSLRVTNGNPACLGTQPGSSTNRVVSVVCTSASTADGGSSGPVAIFNGTLADGITFLDDQALPVNAHGGGVIKEGDTYYLHGEYFPPGLTDGNFHGFTMYSSKNLAAWKNEGIILPQQPSGELGPNRKGERPHIIRCPATGEFVLYAHAADVTYQSDKEIVYATSNVVNGQYAYQGLVKNSSGASIVHGDMSAVVDGGTAYVITESGHVFTLSSDCHSWLSDRAFGAVNPPSGGGESPTVFRAGDTLYWIASNKTGWRANDNVYATAPTMTGPWTQQGLLAPSGQKTWLSQSTWVIPVVGSLGTTYVYWGDHWYGTEADGSKTPGQHNDLTTYVFQPLVFNGVQLSLPAYHGTWTLDLGTGTWTN